MKIDLVSLLMALGVVFVPLLLAWSILARDARPKRRAELDDRES